MTIIGDLFLGHRVAERADWDWGVLVTVGEVIVFLQDYWQLSRLAGLKEILLAVGQGCYACWV